MRIAGTDQPTGFEAIVVLRVESFTILRSRNLHLARDLLFAAGLELSDLID
jgi:hypothetical protein